MLSARRSSVTTAPGCFLSENLGKERLAPLLSLHPRGGGMSGPFSLRRSRAHLIFDVRDIVACPPSRHVALYAWIVVPALNIWQQAWRVTDLLEEDTLKNAGIDRSGDTC